MKVTKRQLRRIIREEIAHQRYDLGKNVADAEFPIVVGYDGGSEIAYDQNELDDILDMIGGGPGSKANIPYSLNSLADMEPETVPTGRGIERYAEGKRKLREYGYGGNLTLAHVQKVFPRKSRGEQADIHEEFGESTSNAPELMQAYIEKYGSLEK